MYKPETQAYETVAWFGFSLGLFVSSSSRWHKDKVCVGMRKAAALSAHAAHRLTDRARFRAPAVPPRHRPRPAFEPTLLRHAPRLCQGPRCDADQFSYDPVPSGTIRYDSVRFGPFRSVPVHFGTFRSVSVRFGTFRYVPVRSSTFRYVSVRFGTFRVVPVRFGAFRCVSVRFGTSRVALVRAILV